MTKNNTATFKIDNVMYPITPEVYNSAQSYLYNQDNIQWVKKDAPYIEYGVNINKNTVKCIRRLLQSMLTDSEIGEYVLENTSIEPFSKQ